MHGGAPLPLQIEELSKKLEEERAKRQEAEKMLASFQDGRG